MLTKIAGRAIGVGFLVLGLTCSIPASAQQAPEMNQNGTQPSPPAPATQQSNPQPSQQRGQQNSGAAQPPTPAQENQAQGTQSQPQATQSQGDQASADQSPKAEQPNGAPTAGPTPTAAPPAKIELPIGTHIPLVLHNGVSTRTARVGDPVYFETLFPIMQDGKIIIPAGSYVSGEITETKRPGRVKGRGELMLRLETLILPNAYMVRFDGSPASASTGGNETTNREGKIEGDSNKKGDASTVAKTTAAGAGIGGLATRTGTGAGIGAGAGLAVGLAAILLTRGPEAELPRGTTLEATLDRPLDFDASKITFTSPGQASTMAGPANREPGRVSSPY
jgi:hypothetical protein